MPVMMVSPALAVTSTAPVLANHAVQGEFSGTNTTTLCATHAISVVPSSAFSQEPHFSPT
jgi:hypothetical protein